MGKTSAPGTYMICPEDGKPGMKREGFRQRAMRMYRVGQTVKLNLKDEEDKRARNFKEVKILRFYPNFVLVDIKGVKESFLYTDFLERMYPDDRK